MVRETGVIRKIVNKTAEQNHGKASAFGFIRSKGGEDLFFLPSHLQQSQKVEWDDVAAAYSAGQLQNVEFEVIDHPKGRRAIEVLLR